MDVLGSPPLERKQLARDRPTRAPVVTRVLVFIKRPSLVERRLLQLYLEVF
jgi:hypothetical protein